MITKEMTHTQWCILMTLVREKIKTHQGNIEHNNRIIKEQTEHPYEDKSANINIIASNRASIIKNEAEIEIGELLLDMLGTPRPEKT